MNKLGFLVSSFLLFSLLFLILPSKIFAQELPTVGANLNAYIPPAGSQCNINVPSQYSTIQAGVDAANWGDTVCVGPGTYNEDVEINKTVRLSGGGVPTTVINGQSPRLRAVYVTATNVIVEGFFIRGAEVSNSVQLNVNDPTLGATVRYNWIKAGNYGIALYIAGSQNLIQNNILEGNNSPYVARVGTNTNILNNTFIGTVNSYDANDTGFYLTAEANSLVKQNAFNPTSGFDDTLIGTNTSVISENNFNGVSTPIKVAGYPAINAQNNWWGDTDPSDNVRGDVDYSNFALIPFPEYPYNEPPIVRILSSKTVVAGDTYTTSSYFLDTGSSSWMATVDYGDGPGIQPLVLSGKTFSLSHVYQNTGTYTVTVSVTDDQDATGTETATITVSNTGITVGANLAAYQPPTGSECNINVPLQYSTIQAGINAANWGDTVCVGPGTYNEDVRINKPIRLSGSGASKSIINAQADWPGAILITTHNVIVEGFLMHGAGAGNNPVIQTGETVSGITLRNNWMVAGYGGIVLWVGPATNNSLIQNNILEGNNSPHIVTGGRTHKIVFLNNTFTGTVNSLGGNTGVVVYMMDPSGLIKQNAFHTTGTTRGLIRANVNSMVNGNNFNNDTLIKVLGTSGPLIINAENNWWGDTDPSDNISRDVDFTPFALGPFPEYSLNQSPTITSTSPIASVLPGTQINASATFTDPDTADTHTATWDWGDGNTTAGSITELNGSGTITGSHSYTSSGAYTVTLTVSDGTNSVIASTNVTILTPIQAVDNTIDTVQTFNLQQGIDSSLDAKLDAAIDSLNDLNTNNDAAAVNSLYAFVNAVEAQRGNKITDAQADSLISQANALIAYLAY